MIGSYRLLVGDVREQLRTLPDQHFHCVVTSPPYWGLRDYGTGQWEGGEPSCDHVRNHGVQGATGQRADRTFTAQAVYTDVCGKCGARRIDRQIGLESAPADYIAVMVDVFGEVWRVLRDDGVCWLNLGDSYCNAKGTAKKPGGRVGPNTCLHSSHKDAGVIPLRRPNKSDADSWGMKSKDLVGIPWMLAFALRAAGWYLRADIIWAKPNPMPESVTDRPTKAHEYIFLLTKSPTYFYDADAIRLPPSGISGGACFDGPMKEEKAHAKMGSALRTQQRAATQEDRQRYMTVGANSRSVWTIPTQSFPEAHFATFPEALPERCIKAGTSEKGCCRVCGAPYERIVEKSRSFESGSGRSGNLPAGKNGHALQGGGETLDIRRGPVVSTATTGWRSTCDCQHAGEPVPCRVLDPFAGSGTTLAVACAMGRMAAGIELNREYAEIAHARINRTIKPQTFVDARKTNGHSLFETID